MRLRNSIVLMLLIAAIGIAACSLPATAASKDDKVTRVAPGGYTVTFNKVKPGLLLAEPAALQASSGTFQTMASGYTIAQGQYKWHYRVVNYYTESLNFYLYWGNPSNSLRMRLFTPDGYVLGPFYDPWDGSYNGAIGVTVSRSGGVAQGTWYEEVYGHWVSGTQSYSI